MKAKKAMRTFICIPAAVLSVFLMAGESDNGADDKISSTSSTEAH